METSDNSSSPNPHKYNTRSKNKSLQEDNEITKYKDENDDELDKADYHELLSKLFPSVYMRRKAKATKSLSNKPMCNIIITKSSKVRNKKRKRSKKTIVDDDNSDEFLSSDDEDNNYIDDDSDDDSEYDSDDDSEYESDDDGDDDSDDDSDDG